jgi:uncharacterized PurR-regulated membrane protein YhhQ (DUF165 family)
MMTTVFGKELQGDHTVNVEGFGVEVELSKMSLSSVFSATDVFVEVEVMGKRNASVIM